MLASNTVVLSRVRSVSLTRTISLLAVLWISCSFLSAQTQSFQTISPLSFTKAYEGANPLPQVITVASTGSAFDFTVNAVSSTGGNWLSISPDSQGGSLNYYSTPTAVTVTVSPDIALAAGTYSAQIVVASTSSSVTMTIPVSLTIASATDTFFDDLPGALTFSMQTKGSAPPAQLIPIRNAGTGTLAFTVSASTADGGGWITLPASSGTAPYLLSVSIDPTKLPGSGLSAGTFTGQVQLKTGGDTVTVPVTVTVGDSVFRQINSLSFTKAFEGANPLPQVITVASTGSAFSFTVNAVSSTGGNWLSISPDSQGDSLNYYPTPTAVTVTVNPDITLAAGTYSAQIVALSTDGAQTQVIPVTLVVEAASSTFFDDLPGQLTFSMQTKGSAPPAQLIPIRNAGTGTLAFTVSASTADGGGWITLPASSGTAPYLLSISIDPTKLPGSGLSAGTFTGQVQLKTGGDTVTVPVTVTVGDSVFRQINSLSFTKAFEGANPLPQVITVASTGSAFSFTVNAVSSTGGNWLSISPDSQGDSLNYYPTPTAVTVTVNPDITLAAGTYSAQIVALSTDGAQTQVIPVTLVVEAASSTFFDDLPGALTFSATATGANPDTLPLPIRNAGSGTLDWVATPITADHGNWLSLSAVTGVAPSTPIVTVIAANLPGKGLVPGVFTGQVLLQSATGIVAIPVTVTIGSNVLRQVQPLAFSKPYQGANPLAQMFTVSSTGNALSFTVNAVNSTGGNWLSISPDSQNDSLSYYSTPTSVTATVKPNVNLAPGTYSASIYVQSTDGANPLVIPVTLTIVSSTSTSGLRFVPVTPCRVADTRGTAGAFGAPALGAAVSREFDIPQSACRIPSTAVAYSLNVTVLPETTLNYLTLWPSGTAQPNVSTLNSYDGRVKANAAIVPAGANGGVNVFVSDGSQVILDVDGYFVPAGTASALAFYPLTPCRVADTRGATGALSGPFLASQSSRSFPLQSSTCGIPATAQAYSLNVTTIPHKTLNYLTTWPTGQSQPNVSTLNAPTGAVTANAAIVPAGSNGDISLFVSDDADVILDVNGYFAPVAAGGLSLYTTTPCRVLDTRGLSGAFNGVLQTAVETSTCALPAAAKAYVLNATVVPPGPLNYLTLWPDGEGQPNVSTLNADDAAITSNMAVVPTNNGKIDTFSSNLTQLILDISSYFAP